MKFNIYPIAEPSIIESLYDEMCEWVGFVEDDSRKWWVAYRCEEFKLPDLDGLPTPVAKDGLPGIAISPNFKTNEVSNCFHNTSVSQDWAGFAGIQLDKSAKSAMMTPCEVKEPFRGHGLQKKFLQVREDWCRCNGYEKAFSLTFVHNIHSANNLIASGYKLRKPFFGSNGKGLYWEKRLTPE